jgi:hypothetical protein
MRPPIVSSCSESSPRGALGTELLTGSAKSPEKPSIRLEAQAQPDGGTTVTADLSTLLAMQAQVRFNPGDIAELSIAWRSAASP